MIRATLIALVLVTTTAEVARACALDQVPSISLDGRLAVANKQAPQTGAQLARWAPFVFLMRPRAGQTVHLAENRKEVAQSLTSQALAHAALWRFGDGRSTPGWKVSHVYRKAGSYRITVLAYDRGSHRWYPFDEATVVVEQR